MAKHRYNGYSRRHGRNVSGGDSLIGLKTHRKGRKSWKYLTRKDNHNLVRYARKHGHF